MAKEWYLRQAKLGAAYELFKQASNETGALDTKIKELLKLVVASVSRCPHCTESHLKKALAAGATKEEITEALLIASVQSAATQLSWHTEFFEKYLGEK